MSFKKNLLISLLSQIYIAFIGVLILPFYLKYMGAEAFGLVGFFSMLQMLFNLLDFGLTPTISRETARFRENGGDALSYRRMFRALSFIFFSLALLGGGILYFLSDSIALGWLQPEQLPVSEIIISLQYMAICVAFRWMCGLYRGVIQGAELLVWLGYFNIFINTLRFVFVIPVMLYWGATPPIFFLYQVIIALLELFVLMCKTQILLPQVPSLEYIGWSFNILKPILKFSLILAFTSVVWTLITQIDKLVLSKLLSLEEYGYFSSAVLVASSIILILVPVANTIMPRMSKLDAQGNLEQLLTVYRQATQFVVVLAGSIACTLIFCTKPLLYFWLGSEKIASHVAPVLKLYAIGNCLFVLAAFPYYLQYAKGTLRLHFYGHLLMLIFLIPLIILGALNYGSLGAGYAWILINGLYFFVWVALVHRKLAPGLHWHWLKDISKIFLVFLIPIFIFLFFQPKSDSRLINLIIVGCFGLASFGSSSLVALYFQKKSPKNDYTAKDFFEYSK